MLDFFTMFCVGISKKIYYPNEKKCPSLRTKKNTAFYRVNHHGVQFHRVSDDIGSYREMWHPYGFVNPQRSVNIKSALTINYKLFRLTGRKGRNAD